MRNVMFKWMLRKCIKQLLSIEMLPLRVRLRNGLSSTRGGVLRGLLRPFHKVSEWLELCPRRSRDGECPGRPSLWGHDGGTQGCPTMFGGGVGEGGRGDDETRASEPPRWPGPRLVAEACPHRGVAHRVETTSQPIEFEPPPPYPAPRFGFRQNRQRHPDWTRSSHFQLSFVSP